MSDSIKTRADELASTIVSWRRDLHQQPELGFEEVNTAAYVKERLDALDLEVHTGIAETGMAAILRAKNPEGPGVLLRADMDALPVTETPGREYGSRTEGRMHACGHDGHMSMLLGAATILSERRDELRRDVLFCFQPGEEGYGGGEKMIQQGVLDLIKIGSVFALHLWSPFAAGTVHVRSGPIMAAQDSFVARILGTGGHAATPHVTRDPIVAAAYAVTALQTIVSRNVDPIDPAVVSIGSLHAGTVSNIIPAEAILEGTLRSFAEGVRELLKKRAAEVIEYAARANGCRSEFTLKSGYPATVNDAGAVETVRRVAAPVFGAENVIEPRPMAPAEDFSYFLQERPGAFILVGAGNKERGITAPHHSSEFDIDESVLPRGAELLTRLALDVGEV